MKHRLKIVLRRVVAVVLHATGLRRLFRARREGVPILMFHNVGDPPSIDYLPSHMKISERRLSKLIDLLHGSGYRTTTATGLADRLAAGETPHEAVVLTFDDGYRDNHDVLLPILRQRGAVATVYVQTGPMKGRLNWLHHYFWVLHREGPHTLAERLAEHVDKAHLQSDLRALPKDAVDAEYQLKRLLKYEIRPDDRDRMLADVFTEMGGNDAELAAAVYLDPDACRALDQAGVEIGAHTVNHLILSSLDPKKQRKEIEGSLRDLESWLGHGVPSFAYPYGRTWDYDEHTIEILDDLGFRNSVTGMPGLNTHATPPMELLRYAVNDDVNLAELMCEVDGVFSWLERRGLNLSVG